MAAIIRITYCVEWNYLPLASSLAVSIKDKFGYIVKLKEGHGGILKVIMGGIVIYDNSSKCGQLPTVDEVLEEIVKIGNWLALFVSKCF